MLSIGPCAGFRSFSPLKAQIELALSGAPVSTPEPENGTPGVPGGPVTSPANAAPALGPAIATAHTAAASMNFFRSIVPSPSKWTPVLPWQILDRRLGGSNRPATRYVRIGDGCSSPPFGRSATGYHRAAARPVRPW